MEQPALDVGSTSEQVLANLARLVSSMADGVQREADILSEVASGHKTYVAAVRAILTGTEIPPEPNPGDGGSIAPSTDAAVAAVNALGQNVSDMVGALAARGSARATELTAVKNKEDEEKKSPGPTPQPEPKPKPPGKAAGAGPGVRD